MGPADLSHAETVLLDPVPMLRSLARQLKQLTEQVESLAHQLQDAQQLPTDLLTLRATQGARLLTVEDLAQLLNVARRVIYGLRHKGLPTLRVGKQLRFDPLQVKAWLDQQQGV
jgi:excisionase family DNA binding protein